MPDDTHADPAPAEAVADFRQMLQTINTAVALVDADTWTITFENACFFRWFPAPAGADEDTLLMRIGKLDVDRAVSRLQSRSVYRFEAEGTKGDRSFPVRVHLRPLDEADHDSPILVEVWDVSKEKEVQYMLDSYSDMSEKNARSLQREKERVEKLLLNVMPRAVYEELKDFGTTTPQRFESASILMLDFVGFTEKALSHDPSATISELNDIFSAFDQIVEMFGCERIRTMGDGYMAVSGMPEANPDHAVNVARVAVRMRRYLERRNAAHPQEWRARIGINTGPVVGSLVGIQKYVYDLFGPGVNLAARMEQISEPMRITVNEETAQGLMDEFVLTERGEFEIKGFGVQKLFFVDSEMH